MDRMIYLSMTGAKASLQRQDVLANNLANVSTAGFRAELAGFRAVPNPVLHLALSDAGTGPVGVLKDASLMVMALRGDVWDDAAMVDLMGHTF